VRSSSRCVADRWRIQIWQAFSTRQWGGFLFNLLLGVLYAICGVVLIVNRWPRPTH
jgi:uncharacterized membrane protein HdeD (DUF308 family)